MLLSLPRNFTAGIITGHTNRLPARSAVFSVQIITLVSRRIMLFYYAKNRAEATAPHGFI